MGTLLATLPGGALTLDAGSLSQVADQIAILPPAIPMIDLLLTYLDGQLRRDGDIQIRHQAVGCAALCALGHVPGHAHRRARAAPSRPAGPPGAAILLV